MKSAIIYYSLDGNCALITGILKTALNADVYEIKTVDQKRRRGFFKYAWGGAQVVFKRKPALQPISVDLNSYEQVILGTPVWAGSPAPALVTFLEGKKISGKKLALFCCHGGGMGQVFRKCKILLPGNTFIGEIDFKYPALGERSTLEQKILDWVKILSAGDES